MYAAWGGNIDIVRLFLDMGLDINAKDKYGKTPLIYATDDGWLNDDLGDMIKLLIKNGADVNEKNIEGETPLMFTAQFGDSKNVSLLIKNGADVNAKDNKGKTAADYARENKKTKILKILGG